MSRLLEAHWNDSYGSYIEPFAGSQPFFHLAPRAAILSDVNTDLVNALETVRDLPRQTFQSLRVRPVRADYYYKLREKNSARLSKVQQAARFIYLNRFCFNGIYRTNKQGHFNVPFSGTKTGNKPSLACLAECSSILTRALIIKGDFETVVREYSRSGDFVYLDPPYVTRARRIFNEYSSDSFSVEDLGRLAKLLTDIDRRGVHFVLSYAFCPEALHLFKNWPSRKHYVQRNIAGFAGKRRVAAELVISNVERINTKD